MTKGLLIVLILWAGAVTYNNTTLTIATINQTRKIATMQTEVAEVKQKTEATMLYIGEMEAREWRREQKRKQGK